MNDTNPDSAADSSRPPCPHCGKSLLQKGHVAAATGYKKWIDEWHCPDHGPVKPLERSEKK